MKMIGIMLMALSVAIAGCASEVKRQSSSLVLLETAPGKRLVLEQPVIFTLDSGYQRTIKPGTEFVEIGSIQQGRVLKPVNTVLTVEGAHMHEAYAVVNNDILAGFYLPVEIAFSPLSQTVVINLKEKMK